MLLKYQKWKMSIIVLLGICKIYIKSITINVQNDSFELFKIGLNWKLQQQYHKLYT